MNRARRAMGFVGMPQDMADVILFLASNEARYVTGLVVSVDGGRATIDHLSPVARRGVAPFGVLPFPGAVTKPKIPSQRSHSTTRFPPLAQGFVYGEDPVNVVNASIGSSLARVLTDFAPGIRRSRRSCDTSTPPATCKAELMCPRYPVAAGRGDDGFGQRLLGFTGDGLFSGAATWVLATGEGVSG